MGYGRFVKKVETFIKRLSFLGLTEFKIRSKINKYEKWSSKQGS